MNQNLIVTGGADAAYPVGAAAVSALRPQAAVASSSGTTSNAIGLRYRFTLLVIITLTDESGPHDPRLINRLGGPGL
ncbi:hypothetical protein KRM28CT15_37930 [Krasilnikovia sp. M28-CT-15]